MQLTPKESQIEFENNYLSIYAAKSNCTKGRKHEENICDIRSEYQRDRDKILHCKAFRRLKHKTQVYISPLGDHYRTRMTHTLEVAQISRTIARALKLNEDLTEAIALGHDLGHTPFGHSGESVLNELLQNGFKHNEQSVRVVSLIEDLNLTYETIEGILNHSYDCTPPQTLEGQIVKIADKIAYLNHDIDDSIRAGVLKIEDIPKECNDYFGTRHSRRISFMVKDLILSSYDKNKIIMSDKCFAMMEKLRDWMFDNVYVDFVAKKEEGKAKKIIKELFNFYKEALKNNPQVNSTNELLTETTVADFIAGMTDRYAIQLYEDNFIPKPMSLQTDDGFLLKLAEKNQILCK